MSRKPDIMADAAYLMLTKNSRELTGKFLIDDDVLRENGITDLDQYANVPGSVCVCVCVCVCVSILGKVVGLFPGSTRFSYCK